MKLLNKRKYSITSGQSTLEFAMILPLIIIIILAASQLGFAVYTKMVFQQASREAVRIISTTNDNNFGLKTARKMCGSGSKIIIEPQKSSQRKLGDIVTVSIYQFPGGLSEMIEKITGRKIMIKAESSMRMECN